MIKTSYFGAYRGKRGVSIALYTPRWFKGKIYTKLQPPKFLLDGYKNGEINQDQYRGIYYECVLQKFGFREIIDDLCDLFNRNWCDCTLLCYEKPGEFCHRHLAAEYLRNNNYMEIEEYNFQDLKDALTFFKSRNLEITKSEDAYCEYSFCMNEENVKEAYSSLGKYEWGMKNVFNKICNIQDNDLIHWHKRCLEKGNGKLFDMP